MRSIANPVSLIAASAIEPHRLCRYNGTQVAYAAAGQRFHFISDAPRADAQADPVVCWSQNTAGVVKLTASGAITAGDLVYVDANGKVTATQKGGAIGMARSTVTADGNLVEVFLDGGDPELFTKTYTALSGDDSANNATIDTGFGTNATTVIVEIASTTGVRRVPQGTVVGTAGSYVISDSGLAINEIIHFIAKR